MPEDPKPTEEVPATTTTSTTRLNTNNTNMFSRDSISQTTLPTTHIKRKKKGHSKVISLGVEDDVPVVSGDLSKLALVEKTPSLTTFKKEFIQNYEIIMGPGSRAKMTKMKQVKPKKEPEHILPNVSKVITKAMENRKREKFRPIPIYKHTIDHPHPFK